MFLAVSDYHSVSGINLEIVRSLMRCIPDLFPKNESEGILSKTKAYVAKLKPTSRSSMFV